MSPGIVKNSHRRRRGPGEQQREWNNFYVDRNLEDTWLEALNCLQAFELISICEGHVETGNRPLFRSRPHINLCFRDSYIPLMVKEFDKIANELQFQLLELFGRSGTSATCEYSVSLNSSIRRQSVRRRQIIRIVAPIRRTTEGMDEEIRAWFENMISAIQKLDDFIADKFKPHETIIGFPEKTLTP